MDYYKLGCNWGTGNPDFLKLLKDYSIVICAEHEMKKGDYVAITQGKTVVALAQITGERVSCISRPELKDSFNEYKIAYEDWNQIADAQIWDIPEQSRFLYELQQGICKIHKQDIRNKVHSLIKTFMESEIVTDCKKLLLGNHNIILTGAPGTGKTYLAKEIAKSMGAEWKLVQFHPSYDYTDFVEGLRPIKDDEKLGFERKDGVFKEFCKKAILASKVDGTDNFDECWNSLIEQLSNVDFIDIPLLSGNRSMKIELNIYGTGLVERLYNGEGENNDKWIRGRSKFFNKEQLYNVYKGLKGVPSGAFDNYMKAIIEYMRKNLELKPYKEGVSSESTKQYIFIIDEINRGEISKIFGELFYSIDSGYRGEKGRVDTQYQNLVPDSDVFKQGFYIPENVYIIGTMNDIDRSVESMDFAMRRRFAWKEITAESRQSMLDSNDAWNGNKPEHNIINEIKVRMNNLNACIIDKYGDEELSQKDRIGLTRAYQIGASYFLKYKLYGNFEDLWSNHIEGLLYEYLRGTTNIESKIERLHTAYNDTEKH